MTATTVSPGCARRHACAAIASTSATAAPGAMLVSGIGRANSSPRPSSQAVDVWVCGVRGLGSDMNNSKAHRSFGSVSGALSVGLRDAN